MAEFNIEKMARKAVQNAFENIIIHGKSALEWLKIISELPEGAKLVDRNKLIEGLEKAAEGYYEKYNWFHIDSIVDEILGAEILIEFKGQIRAVLGF